MLYSGSKLTAHQVKRPVVICAASVSSWNLVALHSYYTGVVGGQSKRAVKSFGEVASAIFQGFLRQSSPAGRAVWRPGNMAEAECRWAGRFVRHDWPSAISDCKASQPAGSRGRNWRWKDGWFYCPVGPSADTDPSDQLEHQWMLCDPSDHSWSISGYCGTYLITVGASVDAVGPIWSQFARTKTKGVCFCCKSPDSGADNPLFQYLNRSEWRYLC